MKADGGETNWQDLQQSMTLQLNLTLIKTSTKRGANLVDTQANTLTHKATYLKKKKKVQESAGENSLFLRVQQSLKSFEIWTE